MTLEPIFEIVASLRRVGQDRLPLGPVLAPPRPFQPPRNPPAPASCSPFTPERNTPAANHPTYSNPATSSELRAASSRESLPLRTSAQRAPDRPPAPYCAGGVESHATGGPRISVQARRRMPSLGGARPPGKPYPRAPCRAPKEMALRTSTLVVLVFVVSGLLQAQTVIGAACNPPGKPGDASCPSQCKTCTTQ